MTFTANAQDLPETLAKKGGQFVGSATCGNSNCHDAPKPWPNSAVRQDEYPKWKAHDPHARALATLKSAKAQEIATRLELGTAYTAQECLGCHSFNVPDSSRLRGAASEEGLGCESCHGPGQSWIGVHTAGLFFYEANIDAGMFPTTDAKPRSKLCMSCHIGTEDKFVSHAFIAAGHPRLKFELNFYTWFSAHDMSGRTEYAHFDVDNDYRQRKPLPYGMKVWAIAQVMQADHMLDLYLSKYKSQGFFPELALFKCQSCHRAISTIEAPKTHSSGILSLNESNLLFLNLINQEFGAKQSQEISRHIEDIRLASTQSQDAFLSATKELKTKIGALLASLEEHNFSASDNRAMIRKIAASMDDAALSSETVELGLLAVGSLSDELYRRDVISDNDFNGIRVKLNALFDEIDIGKLPDRQAIRQSLKEIVQILAE